jgi:hypothetical protein
VVVNNESERMRKKVVVTCFKTLLAFAWREWTKTTKTSVKIVGVPAKNWTNTFLVQIMSIIVLVGWLVMGARTADCCKEQIS